MTHPLDWTLTTDDARPIYFNRPDPVCETREDLRRWELMILMDDLMWALAEGEQNPTVTLNELMARKDLHHDMAWEVCKTAWLEMYGHDRHENQAKN